MQKSSSMSDIATMTGLSIATISRVINQPNKVSPKTRQIVNDAIAELRYRPNPAAQTIRNHRTHVIGFALPLLSEGFTKIVHGAIDEAAQHGYSIMLSKGYATFEEEEDAISHFINKPLDGLLYLPRNIGHKITRIEYFQGIPIVGVSRKDIGLSVPCVYSDGFESGYIATRYLLSLGRRNIAYLAGFLNQKMESFAQFEVLCRSSLNGCYLAVGRYDGYRKALAEADIPFDPSLVLFSDFNGANKSSAVHRLLTHSQKIDGIVGDNDFSSRGMIEQLFLQGIRVPEDISIIGYDNLLVSQSGTPSLSTVDPNYYDVGRTAVQVLLQMLGGKEVSLHHVIAPSLEIRSSTKALAPV